MKQAAKKNDIMTDAERVKNYRKRQREEGAQRLEVWISPKAAAALEKLTESGKRTKKQAVEAAVQQAAINWEVFDEQQDII